MKESASPFRPRRDWRMTPSVWKPTFSYERIARALSASTVSQIRVSPSETNPKRTIVRTASVPHPAPR